MSCKLSLEVYFLSLIIFVFTLFNCSNGFVDSDTLRRFEYKLSFKGPHLVFKDGTVPFWEHSGSTICSNDQIRITPSIRSQKGRIWSKNTIENEDWEIEVSLRINGRGRVGADGMVIYLIKILFLFEKKVFGILKNLKGSLVHR